MVRVVLVTLSMLVAAAAGASAAPDPSVPVPEIIEPPETITVGPNIIGGYNEKCTPRQLNAPETTIHAPGFHVDNQDGEVFGVDPIDVVTIGATTLPPDSVYIPAVILTLADGQEISTPALHLMDMPVSVPKVCVDP